MTDLHKITGTVVHGNKRGKELGFPTANIEPEDETDALPKHGIYAGKIRILNKKYEGQTFLASCSIGYAKTFDATEPTIEAYILDFDDDIYGEKVELTLTKYLRDMIKFATMEDLIAQLKQDVLATRQVN